MELLQSQAPVDRELSGSSASARHGTFDIGKVWYGLVWFGMVWYGLVKFVLDWNIDLNLDLDLDLDLTWT